MAHMTDSDFNDLMFRYFECVSSDDETAELIRLLSENEEHRRLFLREAMLRAELHDWASQQLNQGEVLDEDAGTTVHVPASRWRYWHLGTPARRFWLSTAAAAALLLCVLVPMYFNHGAGTAPSAPPRTSPSAEAVTAPSAKAETPLAASIVKLSGQATLGSGSDQRMLRVGDSPAPGVIVRVAHESAVTLAYSDQTTVEFSENTTFSLGPQEAGKCLRLTQGHLAATVATQPIGKPMTFLTPQADACVLGTRLLLAVTDDATRMDVTEGRVKFSKLDTPISWDVTTGGYVLTASGSTLSANARRSGPDESLRVVEDHEGPLDWEQLPNCAPLAFGISPVAHSGKNGLRIVYESKGGDPYTYGEISHPLTLEPGDHAMRFFINVEHYEGDADWTIQFRQRDRSCWRIAAGPFADLGKGWNMVELELPQEPDNAWGDGTYQPDQVQDLLFGVCQRSAIIIVDDFVVVGSGHP
jgi:hypothetical protein